MSETGGVQVAYGAALDAFPSWTPLTRVAEWQVQRGRQDEFTRTPAGTCRVRVNDLTGYLGSGAEFPTHVQITLRGSPMFRGHVDELNVDVHNSGVVSYAELVGVDALDLFAGIEVAATTPETFGDTVPAGVADGCVFFENGQVDDRQIQILTQAGWSPSLRSVFSGNVNVQESVYDAGASVLQILDDACDSEFPTVANRFIDASGVYRFRGRYARFNPAAYGIPTWYAGTGSHVTSGVAQIRELSYTTSRKSVFNAAMAYPDPNRYPYVAVDLEAQRSTNATSMSKFGVRSWSAENLLTLRHNSNGNTGAEETALFAEYVTSNYKDPVPRISRITFRTLLDSDARAAATWGLMQGVEIGDVVEVTTDWISGRYFVEGITASARELDGNIPDATVSLDLSPAAYWTVDPF